MKRVRPSQFWDSAKRYLFGCIGVAVLTFICVQIEVSVATVGFAYLILLALLSLIGSFIGSLALSIIAAACLAYFLVPPTDRFMVDVPQDALTPSASFTTAII